MARYSVPGIPFSQLCELSDSELFSTLQAGAILHFREAHGDFVSSLRYESGEWVYTIEHGLSRVKEQRFQNVLQFIFRLNGLGVASTTPDGEDMDVTLSLPHQ